MCGIAGVMTKSGAPPPAATLDALQNALRHRGPDGQGRHVHGNVGLVQTRLAIIDLETGDQPFTLHDDGGEPVALIANAEIYNYRELRGQLTDISMQTASDCEPPLHLYRRHGTGFARHLRGMYAIAIHDAEINRLVLSRDPFGIKPLYYTENNNVFAFASEPQALVRAGLVNPEINERSLSELLHLQFTVGRDTVYAGIHRVLPGETLIIRAGRIIERHRINALPDTEPVDLDQDNATRQLDNLLNETVELHQRADVPYGMFLSGGIDSSVLIAMMKRLNAEPVRAFTAGFSGTDVHDEREHAKAVAKAVGAKHTEINFNEADFWKLLPKAAAAIDDPVADYAILPTFKLAGAARDAGLKVVLSGEGGDELFGGYGRYRRAARSRLLGGRRMRSVGNLQGLGVLRMEYRLWRKGIEEEEKSVSRHLTAFQKAQAVDCADWLPNDLLTKLDRCLMANGVEGRVPFVDPVLADFAFRLPDQLKVKKQLGKWLLRTWLENALPESAPMSKKRGFTVPVATWIQNKGAELGPLVAAQPGIARYCRPDVVKSLFRAKGKREGKAQWTLLFFALWHNQYMAGVTGIDIGNADVFEALAG